MVDRDGLRAFLDGADPGRIPDRTDYPFWMRWRMLRPQDAGAAGEDGVVDGAEVVGLRVDIGARQPVVRSWLRGPDGAPLRRLGVDGADAVGVAAAAGVPYRELPDVVRREDLEALWPGSTEGLDRRPWRRWRSP